MSEKKSESIIKPLENNTVFLCGDLDDLAVESLWKEGVWHPIVVVSEPRDERMESSSESPFLRTEGRTRREDV